MIGYGIKSVITRIDKTQYECELEILDIRQVNIKSSQTDAQGEHIDYLMLSEGGILWTQYQEISVRLTQSPLLYSFNETSIYESECNKALTLYGKRLEADYIF